MTRGMGCNPMSTLPRPMPGDVLSGPVVGPSRASRCVIVTRDVSGWVHVHEAASRALARKIPRPPFALEKPAFTAARQACRS